MCKNDELERIVALLRSYPFVEKMAICQNSATQLMDKTHLSLFDVPNIVYPWELEVFAEFSLFADGDNVTRSFNDNNGNDFVDIINTIRNYQHPFLERQKDLDFANAFIMVTALQQFKLQENIIHRLYRYNYFWSFVNSKIDMHNTFLQKFGGIEYREFQNLATLAFFFASLKHNTNAIMGELLLKHRNVVDQLKITREAYKQCQSDKNDDNFDNAVYGFNYLHAFPFIEYRDLIFFPLPYLIADAVTDSLLTRATNADNSLREIIGRDVAQAYIESIFKESNVYEEVLPEQAYRVGKQKIDSPDIMLKNGANICFIDTKLSTPKLEIRKFNQEEIEKTIKKYASNVIQIYHRVKDFLDGYFYPFVNSVPISPTSTFGIVAVLEDAYISRRQIYAEAFNQLQITPDSSEAKFIMEHIKFTNFRDLEMFAFHSQDIFVALLAKAQNPKEWNDMGIHNSQLYAATKSPRIASVEAFVATSRAVILDFINEMVDKGIITKGS